MCAFDAQVDFDYRHKEEHFPAHAALPSGNVQMALVQKDFFAATISLLDRKLRAAIAAEKTDLLTVENCFYSVLPQLRSAERPPVLSIGVTPLSYSSHNAIFYGTRIPLALLPQTLTREQMMEEETHVVLDEVHQSFDMALVQAGGR